MGERFSERVAPFEHYMLADDRPSTPMTFFLRFTVSGAVDLVRFRAAVAEAQARNPLTRSVIAGKAEEPTDKLSWRPAPHPDIDIAVSEQGDEFPAYPGKDPFLDVATEVGLRFFLQGGEHGRTTLLLQAHHAVCDAVGAAQFMEDVFAAYDGLTAGSSDRRWRELDPALLDRREEVAFAEKLTNNRPFASIAAALKQLATPAEPLMPTNTADGAAGDHIFPASAVAVLEADDLAALRRRAKAKGATINDLLLKSLFLALHRKLAKRPTPAKIRLAMPVDLRTEEWQAMPVANMVGIGFIERQRTELQDRAALLDGISQQTRQSKKQAMAATFCRAVALAGRRDNGLVEICAPTHCFSTIVLSNLLQPFARSLLIEEDGRIEAGGLVIESAELLPPLRPMTSIAIGVLTYAGRMHVSLHYDPRAVTPDDARELLDLFTGEMDG